MSTEQAIALVVRGTDWSETSRITTLFTREFGKVRALAKGGRRLRSSFEIAFDLLTVCRVVFIRKNSGGLDLLTEAQMAQRFPHLRTNLRSLNIGYYIAELLSDGTQDYDPHPVLFDAAIAVLNEPLPSIARTTMFELAWLKELGYSPRLDACTVCERSMANTVSPEDRVVYSPDAGGVVCSECVPSTRDRRSLSAATWATLQELVQADVRVVPDFTPQVRHEVRGLLGQLVSSVLGRRPRLLNDVDAT